MRSQCVCDAYGGCPQGCPECPVCWGDDADGPAGEAVAAERERWIKALKDALDGLEDMFPYVPEFFREKWEHQGYIDRAKAALREAQDA